MHLVGYLYEDYHDARSLEHKVKHRTMMMMMMMMITTTTTMMMMMMVMMIKLYGWCVVSDVLKILSSFQTLLTTCLTTQHHVTEFNLHKN
jgi:hypothetical protein